MDRWLGAMFLAAVVVAAPAGGESAGTATVSGFVRDLRDGESLPYAAVSATVDGRETGTLSNADGYYALPGIRPGTLVLTVRHIGYAAHRDTLSLAAGQALRRDIELEREELKMAAVVVEAEAEEADSELSRQASVVLVPMKSLQKMPAMGEADLLRSLHLLPGVQAASDYSSGLYVRGGGPDQTGILLDQVRLYNPSHAFGFFSTFNPDAIKDVTFYKGAYPARYGGNLGAVLDVQNRDGNRRRFSNTGGVSMISSRLVSEGPLGRGSWMAAGRRTYIDPALRALRRSADDLDGLGYWFYDLNAKINTQLTPDDNLMVSAYGGADHLDITVSDSTNTLSFGNEWGNRALTGRWTHLFTPALFGRAILLYSRYHSDIILDLFGTPVEIRNKVREVTLKGDFDWFASPDHTLRAGVDLTRFRFDYKVRFEEYREEQIVEPYLLSAYVQEDWQATPLTEVRLGLRGSWYEEGGRLSLNPRFSLSRILREGWRVKVAGGSYRQYLQLVSTEGFGGGDVWVSLDETVEPGRSYQGVTGLEWEPSGDWRVGLESYYTDLANLVVLDEDQAENAEQRTSEDVFKTGGEGYAAGLELFAEKRRGRLTGWLGYTLGWTRRKFPEVDEGRAFPPKYDRRHDLSLTARYTSGRWTWTTSLVYATGQAYTPAGARYTLRDPASGRPVDRLLAAQRNSARMLPYHRLDAGVRRQARLFGAEVEYYLQIFNLYNRRNEWFIQYDPEDSEREPTVVRMLPIVPTFGFDFRL
ncbi:MAG: TonB-dependent receptor [Gemmatimonadaceae bacterium]|nr:TonB-dependent receptor [Gemmatimonadaceae bacterium]